MPINMEALVNHEFDECPSVEPPTTRGELIDAHDQLLRIADGTNQANQVRAGRVLLDLIELWRVAGTWFDALPARMQVAMDAAFAAAVELAQHTNGLASELSPQANIVLGRCEQWVRRVEMELEDARQHQARVTFWGEHAPEADHQR